MINPVLEKLLHLRLVVGYLGEKANHAWWPTSFFEASSGGFLQPVFPKTASLVRYHGVLEAARILHDEHLSVGTYHLFRLPEELEQDLHNLMSSGAGNTFTENLISNKEAALQLLISWSKGINLDGVGPLLLSEVAEIRKETNLDKMAAAYLGAFQKNNKVYPYLTAAN